MHWTDHERTCGRRGKDYANAVQIRGADKPLCVRRHRLIEDPELVAQSIETNKHRYLLVFRPSQPDTTDFLCITEQFCRCRQRCR
ncbi:hypothetical protein F2P81_002331 [Scophthalmus maximus]|uniref:Uncharacterized protein n=1 Tax=Scophthalmus maximus TaxID=52904 RepID=A0A6A4TUW5_SCOMX|nr:hypothetical protein F2P81_002331 [Scophthalmus maximus]